jgi:5-methyltetrahydropteroyltriglutamate--homocysteine methyltransferase
MKKSTDAILTTHPGTLARSPELHKVVQAIGRGEEVDMQAFDAAARQAVIDVVAKQVETGITVVNDGEQSKTSFSAYIRQRLSGLNGPEVVRPKNLHDREFPEYAARTGEQMHPTCIGPVGWSDFSAVEKDIENMKAAVAKTPPVDAFMTSASPGTITNHHPNRYYANREAYLYAVADVMQREYEAIAAAGFVLQLDCPDLAMSRHLGTSAGLSIEQFRARIQQQVEALNHAVAGIPPEQLRMHLCWGNYEGPHHLDVPLKDIIDVVFSARPSAISFEGCNPRHDHEWKLFEQVKLPEGKMLIPGMLDSTTNYIEHPEVVAQRIVRYARVVGRENVLAGTDCGFAHFVGRAQVDPKIAWAKLRAMADGAQLASAELW